MANEPYYFSHDANARNDDKILELRLEFGWEGYGLYWAIIEILRERTDYHYPTNAIAGLALSLNIGKDKLSTFLKRCHSLELFDENEYGFYSDSLLRRMNKMEEKRLKRVEAGRKGGEAKAKVKQRSSNAIALPSKEKKEKEKKEEYTPGVFLTEKEYSTLLDKHGKDKTEWMLEKLANHKEAKGTTYKSDYGAINSWVVDAAEKGFRKLLPHAPTGAIRTGELAGMVM
ncbi:Lin1244/Lin1753 domain-containing protein [Rufibacter soli]